MSKLNIQNEKEIYIKKNNCKRMMYLNPFMDQRSASSWERVWKGRGRYLS
jgi:predicted GIY-YIG superfamily endonuclease